MKVSEQQRTEWTENPVTIALRELYWIELESVRACSVTDCMVRGNPELTQENLIEQTCRELEYVAFIACLNGDWSELEIDDEE